MKSVLFNLAIAGLGVFCWDWQLEKSPHPRRLGLQERASLQTTELGGDRWPMEFEKVQESAGAILFNHNLDYIQAIDLSQGASVKFTYGNIVNWHPGKGVYGGNDPEFERQSLERVWLDFSQQHSRGFCVTNGQFFRDDRASATELAFPVKAEGRIVTDGYAGISEYPGEKLMLEVWSDRATISPFNAAAFYESNAPNIIVSLSEKADKGSENRVGRTFVGVSDRNGDGIGETLLIFTSKSASQPHAAQTLREFGATQTLMLDGGGSTQLRCDDRAYIDSSRTIPQGVGAIAAH